MADTVASSPVVTSDAVDQAGWIGSGPQGRRQERQITSVRIIFLFVFFLPERSKFDSIYLWSNMVGFQNTLVVRCDKGSERGVSWVVSNS